MIFKVPFRISGYVEIEARNADEAWELLHMQGIDELTEDQDVTVDFELPEAQE